MPDFMNINSIINKIAGNDSAGLDSSKIDTILEYNNLSSYLNGSYFDEKTRSVKKFSRKELKLLKEECAKARKELGEFFEDDKALPKINMQNAKEYSRIVAHLRYQDARSEDEELTYKKTMQALYDFVNSNGYDISDMDIEDCDYRHFVDIVLKNNEIESRNKLLEENVLKAIKEPYDNKILQNKVNEFIKENNPLPLTDRSEDIDMGNGLFDKPAIQETNLCWAHAGINTLLTTEEGKKLLECNSYYDKTTGVFAIHLQEAQNNGFHDGIYIITPDEIKNDGQELSSGEGDVTAYMLAVKKYFDEVNADPELAQKMEAENQSTRSVENGNTDYRFFELITGGKHIEYTIVNQTFYEPAIRSGIGNSTPYYLNFGFVADMIENKKGSVVLSVGGHSISVIGVRNGNLLIQESNNDSDFSDKLIDKENDYKIFNQVEDINGLRTYELSPNDYFHYIKSVSYLKWQ